MTVVITEKTVRVVEVDWIALAESLENEVLAKLEDDIIEWGQDTSMLSMFLRDAADGLDVAVLLANGRWDSAESKIYNMDTVARDYIFDWIEKHSCDNLFDVLREQ